MAGGGGKGGSTSTEVSIPAWLEDAAKSGLARGTQAAGIGYVPYRGPDVAALTPMQEAAMANTSMASSAFGLGASPLPGAGMPTVQTFADRVNDVLVDVRSAAVFQRGLDPVLNLLLVYCHPCTLTILSVIDGADGA